MYDIFNSEKTEFKEYDNQMTEKKLSQADVEIIQS